MSTFLEQVREWLDTKTRELLCPEPPTKVTEIGIESYSLLLLRHGNDKRRTEDVVAAIQKENPVILVEYPFVVAQEMTLDEAMVGQFALACCDCISAFVRDEVICNTDRDYLQQLNEQVAHSSEFEFVCTELLNIPHTEDVRRFCWQFLGMATAVSCPLKLRVFRKKARLMEYWAKRSGIEMNVL
jgi:hypothetical protein